jgi:MFS family permease
VGGLSDRLGSKPFLLAAPLVGAGAALCFLAATRLFPAQRGGTFDVQLVALLLFVLMGRLFEGAAAALSTPAGLGYITGATESSEKLRARVMTAFEVATVAGLALAIPFGGKVSSLLGIWGFAVVLVLNVSNAALLALCLKERAQRPAHRVRLKARHSLVASLSVIRSKRVFTFLPAWLSINALVGAWLTLCTIILTYPEPAARLRHPGQLLYGGFGQEFATLLLGGFGLLFLAGMGLWLFALPRLRRTTVMLIALGGLSASILGLTIINSLGESQVRTLLGPHALYLPLPLVVCGVLLLSGFTPASLNHMAAIAEAAPGNRGAVMGLYSVVMGAGQLIGAALGGLCVDLGGFYGLMVFSVAMGLVSLASVLYMRILDQDFR